MVKIDLPDAVYERAQHDADASGMTLDDYVASLIESWPTPGANPGLVFTPEILSELDRIVASIEEEARQRA